MVMWLMSHDLEILMCYTNTDKRNRPFLRMFPLSWKIQGGPKKGSQRNLHITSSNTGRFSKFLHYNILQQICNKKVSHPALNASLHYLVKYLRHKTSVFCELWQSY